MIDRSRIPICLATAAALALVPLLLPTAASALGVELEARYWATDIRGSADVRDEALPIPIDLGDDLGFASDDSVEGRFTFRPGLGLFLRLAYQSLAIDGEAGLETLLPVPPGTGLLRSSLDFEYGRVALGWQYVAPRRVVRIGPFFEAKGVRGDASLALVSPLLTDSVTDRFEAGFASAGMLLEVQATARLQLFAEASVAIDQDEADVTDREAGARFQVAGPFAIGAGYRAFEIDGSIDNVMLRLDYSGPFLTAVLRY